ncbi:MAG: GNAT family N-acetyltransferase [Oscillospiraceae bacterium]|nr:GNAT family N-acetyltransferase [Oscillospiraceae bacterium]
MTKQQQVRLGGAADIPAVVRLRLAYLADEHGVPETALDPRIAAQLPAYFAAHLSKDCFAALWESPDGTPAAAALLVTHDMPANPSFPTGRAGTVYSVYTAPSYRRQGVASALIALLLETAERERLDRVRLSATAGGKPLYEKIGFSAMAAHYTEMEYICKGKG